MISFPFGKKKKEEEEELELPDFNIEEQTKRNTQEFQQETQPEGYTQYQYNWEEYINSLVESVVTERVKEIRNEIELLKVWREKIDAELKTIKGYIDELNRKMDDVYSKVIGKIKDYDTTMKETSAEIKALHKVLQTMIPTISESVRELKGVIEEIKKLREKP